MGLKSLGLKPKRRGGLKGLSHSWYKVALNLATTHTCRHILRGAFEALSKPQGRWMGQVEAQPERGQQTADLTTLSGVF
jgi:hypothetical protein